MSQGLKHVSHHLTPRFFLYLQLLIATIVSIRAES